MKRRETTGSAGILPARSEGEKIAGTDAGARGNPPFSHSVIRHLKSMNTPRLWSQADADLAEKVKKTRRPNRRRVSGLIIKKRGLAQLDLRPEMPAVDLVIFLAASFGRNERAALPACHISELPISCNSWVSASW